MHTGRRHAMIPSMLPCQSERRSPPRRRARGAALAAVLVAVVGSATADLAYVTDVVGDVSLAEPAGRQPVHVLTVLEARASLRLGPDARVALLYAARGDEYLLSGPARVELGAMAPVVHEGPPAVRRDGMHGRAGPLRIRPAGVVQAGFVMRGRDAGVNLRSPIGTVLSDDPVLRWRPLDAGTRYRVTLTDAAGAVVFAGETQHATVRLPQGVRLTRGRHHAWRVEATLPGGEVRTGHAAFQVATAALRDAVAASRPPPGAAVSVRAAFAIWLETMDLADEARDFWRVLAHERPDDPNLRVRASE